MAESYDGEKPGDEETAVQDEFIKAHERDVAPEIEFHQTDPSAPVPDNEFELDPLTLEPRRIKGGDEPLDLPDPAAAATDVKLADFIREPSEPAGDSASFHASQNRGGVSASDKFPVAGLVMILAAAGSSAFVIYWYLMG